MHPARFTVLPAVWPKEQRETTHKYGKPSRKGVRSIRVKLDSTMEWTFEFSRKASKFLEQHRLPDTFASEAVLSSSSETLGRSGRRRRKSYCGSQRELIAADRKSSRSRRFRKFSRVS